MNYNKLILTIFIFNYSILLINAGVGFLKDQRKCLIKCQNHGVCAYEIGRPQIHRCICMTNMFYGDLCQYSVTAPPPTQRILVTTTQEIPSAQIEPHRPIKIIPKMVNEEAAVHENDNGEEEEAAHADEEVSLDETSMEKPEEIPSSGGKASYLTLEEAEDDNNNKKSVELDKNDDDYSEPPPPTATTTEEESSNSVEIQPNENKNVESVSNGYFEPDTQMGQYQSSKTTHSVEPDNVMEEESGWMMVKKKTNSASSLNFYFISFLTSATTILFFNQFLF